VGAPGFEVAAEACTVGAGPIALHAAPETTSSDYRAAVGADGTVYIPVDVTSVSAATRFSGTAVGLPLEYQARNVAMYNDQGYLMQLLDPTSPRLFDLKDGDLHSSTTLSYWRHEFTTYKAEEAGEAHQHDAAGGRHAHGTPPGDHEDHVGGARGTSLARRH